MQGGAAKFFPVGQQHDLGSCVDHRTFTAGDAFVHVIAGQPIDGGGRKESEVDLQAGEAFFGHHSKEAVEFSTVGAAERDEVYPLHIG